MCQSKAAGGQRCYGHANTGFEHAHACLTAAHASGDPRRIASAEHRFDRHAVTLASTPEGHTKIQQWATDAADAYDFHTEARYRDIARRGQTLRTVNTAAADTVRAARITGLQPMLPRTTRLLDRILTAATAEERQFAWSALARTPIEEWTPGDRVTLATHLDKMPGGWSTQVRYWHRLRDHGKAHLEERATLREPLFRYRERMAPLLDEPVAAHR